MAFRYNNAKTPSKLRLINFLNVFLSGIMCLPGTRMWRRGANLEGDTANFVETEQVLELGGFTSSFMMVTIHLQNKLHT